MKKRKKIDKWSEKRHYLTCIKKKVTLLSLGVRDYIHLQTILYQLGIMANCKIIEIPTISIYNSYESLIKDNVSKILTKGYNKREVENILSQYIIEKDGRYEYPYTFHAVLLYWKPTKV
ncbi:MAG TPA: hypothetical protein VEY70_12240 [Metabacillus sp.]|nr:hypothetical protein [Metabacillus sp.]